MKRIIFALLISISSITMNAQYHSGTSTTGTRDIFGNTTTPHRDSYGRVIGTSTTGSTDIFGNTTTIQTTNNGTFIWTW